MAVPTHAELLGAFAVSEGNLELDSVGLKLARHLWVVESEGLQEAQRVGGIVVVLALALLGRRAVPARERRVDFGRWRKPSLAILVPSIP